MKLLDFVLGKKISKTRAIPLVVKITVLFTIIILVSNLATNYINLIFNRKELIQVMKEVLIKDLKSLYNFANNQYEIYQYNMDMNASVESIENKAKQDFKNKNSIAIGLKENGTLLFQSFNNPETSKEDNFTDIKELESMKEKLAENINQDSITFKFDKKNYLGIYKYNLKWKAFIIRAENQKEFYAKSNYIFILISIIIIVLTIFCSIIGVFLIQYVLRYVQIITSSIMKMIEGQKLETIDLQGASSDDVTYLGVAFNSLSSTINNLMKIFLKFVNKDIAQKAYNERVVRLEGKKKDLTILFSDIKSFTYMTETLGIEIIKLLNIHYENAIHYVLTHDGIVGSIIGDALLAVYGALDNPTENKSLQAVKSGYEIQRVTAELRESMKTTRDELVKRNGKLSMEEQRIFKAVMIEIGVGIDGGDVFYGTIGSNMRMTNTVIGDNVNSASRLEGLTRIYRVPIICSEYIKNDIDENVKNHDILFYEIDQVQVKGKTIGKKVYWPIFVKDMNNKFKNALESFSQGLHYYYEGNWSKAFVEFNNCNLPLADVFKDRTKNYKCPKDWNGIWTMTTK